MRQQERSLQWTWRRQLARRKKQRKIRSRNGSHARTRTETARYLAEGSSSDFAQETQSGFHRHAQRMLNRPFQFQKRRQSFIGTHNVTLFVRTIRSFTDTD